MRKINLLSFLLILNLAVTASLASAFSFPWSKKTVSLGLPLKCTLNKDCFILYYPDRIAEQGFRDYKCGKLSFENNKSVVFDFISEDAALKDIEVIAAADGVVSKIVLEKPAQGVNSMLDTGVPYLNIAHGNGFKTQYSYLTKHKILVKKGQRVKQGDVIALTDHKNAGFNEVYFSVFKNDRAIDPFLGPDASYGCNTEGKSLWQMDIEYSPVTIIKADFHSTDLFQRNILFDIKTWGLLEGDIETIELHDPSKAVVAKTRQDVENDGVFYRSKVVFNEALGERLEEGLWSIQYKVKRKNKVIFVYNDSFVISRQAHDSWKKL